MPPVKVKDNMALRSREYVIQMRGIEIARFELLQGHELAIPSGNPRSGAARQTDARSGVRTAGDCGFARIRPDRARSSGYTVVDAVSVIGTHLTEVVRRHAHELFTRQDAKDFCDRVAQENPKVIEDLVPKLLSSSHDPASIAEHAAGTRADSRRVSEFWKPWEKRRKPARTRCC